MKPPYANRRRRRPTVLRRIIPREEVFPMIRHTPATAEDTRRGHQCRATIALDGKHYRCRRAHVDGIHDAFVEHHDGGAVRW